MNRLPKTALSPRVEGLEVRTLMSASQVSSNLVATTPPTLTTSDVNTLLNRAAAASASNDGIIAIVDRGGNILGVRVESGVSPEITSNPEKLVFAIDGAVSEARTGAFFGNNQAPLTARTIQDISQSTMTQREIQSDPNIPDPNSTDRGPGYVAPVGMKGHFPPRVQYTPQVDLFQIEHTNRDSIINPGPNHVRQDTISNDPVNPTIIPSPTGDDVKLPNRFNVPDQYIRLVDPSKPPNFVFPDGTPNKIYFNAPESYGFVSGMYPSAQSRGIGTLPGGIPLYKNYKTPAGKAMINEVGGIGVFFPGTTGYATEENSKLNEAPYRDPTKPDRAEEAEYIAFVAAGGSNGAGASFNTPKANARLAAASGLTANDLALPGGGKFLNGFDLPFGRIDLVGITLDIFGGGGRQGVKNLLEYGATLGTGNALNGVNEPIAIGGVASAPTVTMMTPPTTNLNNGLIVPDGWLVTPHDAQDGSGLTAQDVTNIILRGVKEATVIRAAIRLPQDSTARMILAVSDKAGNILGLYRMSDATFFSLDVAVAKSRNVMYYADPTQLQPQDRVSNVPLGTAFTNRTFRYLTEPRFPEGIDGNPPGPFSILNEATITAGVNRKPANSFQTVQGFDSFNPQTNFHQPWNTILPGTTTPVGLNQDGIVFFPGAVPLYKDVNGTKQLVGGLGVSGDGVDQDDDVTLVASKGYSTGGTGVRRSDQVMVRGARLPYQKNNRQPHEPYNQIPAPFPQQAPGGGIKPILPRSAKK